MHSHLLNLKSRLHGDNNRKLWLFKVNSSKWYFQSVYSKILVNITKTIAFLHEASLASLVFLPYYYRGVPFTHDEFPDGRNIVYIHLILLTHSGCYVQGAAEATPAWAWLVG